MKKAVGILLSVTFLLGLGLTGFAQKTPVLDNREKRQQKRIKRGVKTGTLTKNEAIRMEKQQVKTHKMEAKAKSDGKVTVKERAKLQHRSNKTSRRIYKQKHDNQNQRR